MTRRTDAPTHRRTAVWRTLLLCVGCVGASVRLSAQCPDGSPPPCQGRVGPPRTTVAVLPFDNLSRDSSDAYLARDLTEEITNRLVKLERLTVTAATVMRRYRGSDNPRTVAQTLRVAYLVSGSVRRDRDRLRISVELLRARDGVAPWTDIFDRRDTSLLDVQIQIARSVASAITGRLMPQEQQVLAVRPTRDQLAYDHFARGNYLLGQRTTRSILRAIQEYAAALRRDSRFAAALAYQATAFSLLSGSYYDSALVGLPRDSLSARALALSAQALEADSNSAEAIGVAAFRLPAAERRVMLERAIRINPHNADILQSYANALAALGDTSGAMEALRRAIDEDPTHAPALLSLGMRALYAGQFDEARHWLDSAVALRPEAYFFYFDRALAHLRSGDTAVIAADVADIRRLDHPVAADALFLLLSVARHDTATVRTLAASLLTATAPPLDCRLNFDCIQTAMALSLAGNPDAALALLERMTPLGPWLGEWLAMQEFDAIRNHPRFRRLVEATRPTPGR